MKDDTHKMPFFRIKTKLWQRIPHKDNERTCGDCGVAAGQYHHSGCDLEICPRCRGQAISCDCSGVYLANVVDFRNDKIVTRPDEETINYLIDEMLSEERLDLSKVRCLMMNIAEIDRDIFNNPQNNAQIVHRILRRLRTPLLAKIRKVEKRLQKVSEQKVALCKANSTLVTDNKVLRETNEKLQDHVHQMIDFSAF